MSKFTFIDLFAGIGGFRVPLEELGGECLGYSEVDKNAIQVYRENFRTEEEISLGDLRGADFDGLNPDLLVGGVPCQPWSVAGKMKGYDDPRGALWFDVLRVVELCQPKAFIFENVKGLVQPRNKASLSLLLNSFSELGYKTHYEVLNTCDFGIPQDRERVFFVGFKSGADFSFPSPQGTPPPLKAVLEGLPQQAFPRLKFSADMLFGGRKPASRGKFKKEDELNDFFLFSDIRNGHSTIHSWDLIPTTEKEKEICLEILRSRRKKKYGNKDGNPLSLDVLSSLIEGVDAEILQSLVGKKILKQDHEGRYLFVNSKGSTGIGGVCKVYLPHSIAVSTLTATERKDFVATASIPDCEPCEYKLNFIENIYKKGLFRALSVDDYRVLQGFPRDFRPHPFERQAKKQFGNAVSIPVVKALASRVVESCGLG